MKGDAKKVDEIFEERLLTEYYLERVSPPKAVAMEIEEGL